MAVNVFKILRSIVQGNRPTGHTYGEPYVNFAENQFGVLDSGNNPRDLIGTPVFSSGTSYPAGKTVSNGGLLYVSNTAVAAGTFTPSQWNQVASFPSGTVMLFYQAAAPLGWTQVTTHNDKLLRVVSGSGGGSGGTNSFSTFNAQTVTGNHTLVVGEIPSNLNSAGSNTLTLYPLNNTNNQFPLATGSWSGENILSDTTTNANFPAMAYNIGIGTGAYVQGTNTISVQVNNAGNGAHNHPVTIQIQYVDMIIASKN